MPAWLMWGDLANAGMLAEAAVLLAVVKLMVLVFSFVTKAMKAGETGTPKLVAVFLIVSAQAEQAGATKSSSCLLKGWGYSESL